MQLAPGALPICAAVPHKCALRGHCADMNVIAGGYLRFAGVAAARQATVAERYAHPDLIGRALEPDATTDGDFGLDAVARQLEQSTQPAHGTPRTMHCERCANRAAQA